MARSKEGKKVGNITLLRNIHQTDYASPKQPDYRGKLTIEGENFECALWVNNDIHQVPLHLSGQITIKELDTTPNT